MISRTEAVKAAVPPEADCPPDHLTPDHLRGLPPILTNGCKVLILGSFPGKYSLEKQQYYAHPRNQFWTIMGAVLSHDPAPLSYPERIRILLQNNIGLWDIYYSCQRYGSLDSAIRAPIWNPLQNLPEWAPELTKVLFNGSTSAKAVGVFKSIELRNIQTERLPSTSPAHASVSIEQKTKVWKKAVLG